VADLDNVSFGAGSNAKAVRGIGSAYFGVPVYSILPELLLANTELAAGQDTPVAVSIPDLPPNADIDSCIIDLYVDDSSSTAPSQHTAVAITKQGDSNASGNFGVDVAQPSRPTNLKLLLGDTTVWTQAGTLNQSRYTLPEAKDALNAYLEKQKATSPLQKLAFVAHSDSPGRVGLSVKLDYVQIKTQSWPNPLDKTTRIDRNLPLSFGAIVRVSLDPLIDQTSVAVKLESLSTDLDGKFGPDRLLAHLDAHDGRQFATIDTDYSLAQAFQLTGTTPDGRQILHSPVNCTGISCLVDSQDKSELYAEIQPDGAGFPGSGAPLAKGTVSITPARPDGQPLPWAFVKFAAPVKLDTDSPYWLVLKAVQGSLTVALAEVADPPGAAPLSAGRLCVSRSSQLWKDMFRSNSDPQVASLTGVVYLPGKDDQTAALQIVTSGAPQGLTLSTAADPTQKPQTVQQSTQNADWRQVTLEVRSYAAGTLHLANVIQRFRVSG
jgi:hypothetical protein